MKTLKYGDKGKDVKKLQKILQKQGFLRGTIDDKFFKSTREAVIYFQETHLGPDGEFLLPDGVVGKATWWALQNPVGDAQKSYLPESIPDGLTPLRIKQLEIALQEHQKGVQEDPDGSNSGDGVTRYGGNKLPWCCFFWSWCNKQCFSPYSLEVRYGRCTSAWEKAQKLGMAREKGDYIPIPGDAFVMMYRDKDGKLTGVGHIGFVLRVEVKDGKAVAINTIEGNTSNRVKIGKRDLTKDSIVGFINNFPEDEQPTDWEKGLVQSTSVEKESTRAISVKKRSIKKKALCVGISEFQERHIPPLPGCVNDAILLADTLKEHYGFTTAGTRLLTNGNATKAGIIKRLNWLVEGASSGDVLVFTFASHGTWTVDRSGDEDPGSQLQGRDEMLVPYDYEKENGLVDDEIGKILDQVPAGVRLYCIIDTCHSGTATRALFSPFQAAGALKNRFLPPSPDIMNRFSPETGWRSRRTTQEDRMNRISISGCTDDEESLDYPTRNGSHGLMTFSLCQALEAANWQGSVAEIFQEMQQNVIRVARALNFTQTPQLHGPEELRNAQIFR